MRHSKELEEAFGLQVSVGLAAYLADRDLKLGEVTHRVPVVQRTNGRDVPLTMDVVVAGGVPSNPSELIDSERMRELIREAEESYDLVVIDTSPAGLVADAIPVMNEASAVVIVGRVGRGPQARRRRERLRGRAPGDVMSASDLSSPLPSAPRSVVAVALFLAAADEVGDAAPARGQVQPEGGRVDALELLAQPACLRARDPVPADERGVAAECERAREVHCVIAAQLEFFGKLACLAREGLSRSRRRVSCSEVISTASENHRG